MVPSPSAALSDIEQLEEKAGKIGISSRFHTAPKKMTDDYIVSEKVLGSGFNGVVKMATAKDSSSSQRYAVKALKFANIPADKKSQLESEVKVFLCMDHPHITRLYDVYESDNFLYLIMECMEGGELFDRVSELKTFCERDAAEAVNQMLLSLNYIHSHGIVHRDIKLENYLYDKRGSNHLKLIDFGFSKTEDPNSKMHASCGTLAYVAPEVLRKNYTSQCDLWSLGVISFILLAGYMPFSGSDRLQAQRIMQGQFTLKPARWNKVSMDGLEFTRSLLQVDPEKRLTAKQALEHDWIKNREHKEAVVDNGIADALRAFGKSTKFHRCCMEMMAWSLSNEERAQVRDAFIAMGENKQGTITLLELRKVLDEKFHVPSEEIQSIFQAMDHCHDEEIHYSVFLAAMVGARIAMHDDHLKSAFRKFDSDNSGYITKDDLREVLGETYEGETVDELMREADLDKNGEISYPEFVAYLTGQPPEGHATDVVDSVGKARLRAATEPDASITTTSSSMSRLKKKLMLKLSGGCSDWLKPRGCSEWIEPPYARRHSIAIGGLAD